MTRLLLGLVSPMGTKLILKLDVKLDQLPPVGYAVMVKEGWPAVPILAGILNLAGEIDAWLTLKPMPVKDLVVAHEQLENLGWRKAQETPAQPGG